MPRRKASHKKTPKSSMKKQEKIHPILELSDKIEKEFLQVPSKLAALCKKETDALKKKEHKINTTLKTAQTKEKSLRKKQSILLKASHSPTGKKKVLAGKKAITTATNIVKDLTQKADQIKKIRLQLESKQIQFTLLRKELIQLDKKLKAQAKKSKKNSAIPKRKKTVKIKKSQINTTPINNRPAERENSREHQGSLLSEETTEIS